MTLPSRLPAFGALAAGALVVLAACGGSSDTRTGPPPITPPDTVGLTSCTAGNGGVFADATQPATAVTATSGPLGTLGRGDVSTQYTSELNVRGGYAYTTTWGIRGANPGNTIRAWDVSGATPRLVSRYDVSGATTTGDVQVSDDGRYLAVATERSGGSLVLFDLADPAHPKQVSRFCSTQTSPGVHTAELARVNGTLYAFLSIDPSPVQLVVLDLSDPAKPRQVLAKPMGNPYVHDVFVRDGILFTALWDDGMTIWDIGGGAKGGSVTNPVQLGNVRTVGGEVHNIWWFHDPATGSKRYAFVGEEGPGSIGSSARGDVHVVDVSDFTNPREVAFYAVPGAGTHNFSLDESRGVLYAAYYNAGVRAIDVRGDLSTCTPAQKSADGRCNLGLMGRELATGLTSAGFPVYVWGVQQVGDAVYASDMLNGLWKLNAVVR